MTVMAVAQASFQVYSMFSRRGGSDRLVHQTAMIREISEQLSVVNAKLDVLYEGIARLEGAVRSLPKATTMQLLSTQLGGALRHASAIFRTYQHYLSAESGFATHFGIMHARNEVADEVAEVLLAVTTFRHALLQEDSEVLCPAISAAWYVELQLHMLSKGYREERLWESADDYRKILQRWKDEMLLPEIKAYEAELSNHHAEMNGLSPYFSWSGVHSIAQSTSNHAGNIVAWTTTTVTGVQESLQATPTPGSPTFSALIQEQNALAVLGSSSGFDCRAFQFYDWVASSNRLEASMTRGDRNYNPDVGPICASWAARPCPFPGFAVSLLNKEKARIASIEDLFARRVVHGYLLVCCEHALSSVNDVLARISS